MVIEAKSVGLIYDLDKDQQTVALKNIDLCIQPGITTSLIGPSGSGKTSLLMVLSGLKRPTTGSVVYDNEDIEPFSEEELSHFRREHFAFIFQKHLLIDYMTVLDNVLVPLRRVDDAIAKKAHLLLDELGMKPFEKKYPNQLSFGQRQRVAIARALISSPKVLFADEPTAFLDHKQAMEVMHTLQSHTAQASLLVATHDPTVLSMTHQVVELWDGHVKAVKTNS